MPKSIKFLSADNSRVRQRRGNFVPLGKAKIERLRGAVEAHSSDRLGKRIWQKVQTKDRLRKRLRAACANLGDYQQLTLFEVMRVTRRKAKLSLSEMSAATGIPPESLGDLEKGRIDITSLQPIWLASLTEAYEFSITNIEGFLRLYAFRKERRRFKFAGTDHKAFRQKYIKKLVTLLKRYGRPELISRSNISTSIR